MCDYNYGEVFIPNIERILYESEGYECAMKYLDDMGVPTECGGEELSLVGRIVKYKEMNNDIR